VTGSDARRGEAGFSLPELLVVMVLSSIVLAGLAVVFNASMQASRGVTARVATTGDARIALDAMTQRMRVAVVPPNRINAFDMSNLAAAPNFQVGLPSVPLATEVAFFASLTVPGSTADPTPSLVDYSIDTTAGCLREKVTRASGASPAFTWPAANTQSRCLAFGAINVDGTALFDYFADGRTDTPMTVALAADNARLVDSIGIDCWVTGTDTTDIPPTKIYSRVSLANLNADDLVAGS
jgi:prepilin-type N-terminal cleavage/methylation domain-containing protein